MAESSKGKEKRSRPYEDAAGEDAYNIALRMTREKSARKAPAKRGRGPGSTGKGSGSIVGRGAGAAPPDIDNGGAEGKTIPVEVTKAIKLGEMDDSYMVYYTRRSNVTKKPPTKYDNSVHLEFQSYDGVGIEVKKAREQNPYASPRLAAIDFRFWSVFHYNFYSSVILNKNKITPMKWVDWDHFEQIQMSEVQEVLDLVDMHGMKDLMGFRYDWNVEVLSQFHATFYNDTDTDTIHWMTEGVHYKLDFTTFARLLGFGKADREDEVLHHIRHLKADKIAEAYERPEMADGSTVGLKPVYYAMNNLMRETINPKRGSDSTSLRKYATTLLSRMLPGARTFSVSRFIWYEICHSLNDGRNNLSYAPYLMYIIERVSGLIFKKDGEHQPYQLKHWCHARKEAAMKAFSEPETPAAPTTSAGPSSSTPKDKKFSKLLKNIFSMCKYSSCQVYEARKDINRLLNHANLPAEHLSTPPIFFVSSSSSSSEEIPSPHSPSDDEPLSSKLRRASGSRTTVRKSPRTPKPHGKAAAAEEEEESASDEDTEEEEHWDSDE